MVDRGNGEGFVSRAVVLVFQLYKSRCSSVLTVSRVDGTLSTPSVLHLRLSLLRPQIIVLLEYFGAKLGRVESLYFGDVFVCL